MPSRLLLAYNVSGLSAVLIFCVTSSPVTKDKIKAEAE